MMDGWMVVLISIALQLRRQLKVTTQHDCFCTKLSRRKLHRQPAVALCPLSAENQGKAFSPLAWPWWSQEAVCCDSCLLVAFYRNRSTFIKSAEKSFSPCFQSSSKDKDVCTWRTARQRAKAFLVQCNSPLTYVQRKPSRTLCVALKSFPHWKSNIAKDKNPDWTMMNAAHPYKKHDYKTTQEKQSLS